MTNIVGVWLHNNAYEKFFKQFYYFYKLLSQSSVIEFNLLFW
jgi:hypothetical protein